MADVTRERRRVPIGLDTYYNAARGLYYVTAGPFEGEWLTRDQVDVIDAMLIDGEPIERCREVLRAMRDQADREEREAWLDAQWTRRREEAARRSRNRRLSLVRPNVSARARAPRRAHVSRLTRATLDSGGDAPPPRLPFLAAPAQPSDVEVHHG